jgi:hypothetical protein
MRGECSKFEMVGPKGKDFDIVGCWLCAARNCLKGLSGDEMTGLLIFRTGRNSVSRSRAVVLDGVMDDESSA